LAFEANNQHIWVVHQDLEIGFPSYVTEDVIIVIESLVKSQCKGNALKHFQFFYFLFFVDFFHLFISYLCKFMVFVWSGKSYKKFDESVGN
jgi:hypothetical protein